MCVKTKQKNNVATIRNDNLEVKRAVRIHPGSNCFTLRNVLQVNSTMRAAGQDTMHYCFVWKKWQWLVSLWMEANLCLNTGGCREVKGGLSGGRWRRQAVYWELDQWQVNPLWRKPFIFVKAFLVGIRRGPDGEGKEIYWCEIQNR